MFPLVLLGLCAIVSAADVPCPGGKEVCPDFATCCKVSQEDYGCCPLSSAVCCDDFIHCCPQGSRCDGGMCVRSTYNSSSVGISKKLNVVCPGGKYSCPYESTCCTDEQGKVTGCCMEPDAVCCADGESCCPKNTKCDLDLKQCIDANSQDIKAQKQKKPEYEGSVKSSSKHKLYKSFMLALSQYSKTICPDPAFACPDGTTCCELPDKKWGCCPFPDANCCSDHMHCCPSDMQCSVSSQSCERGGLNISSQKTFSAFKVADVEI